jgi:hypothetical protein
MFRFPLCLFPLALAIAGAAPTSAASGAAARGGELKQWHKITLTTAIEFTTIGLTPD